MGAPGGAAGLGGSDRRTHSCVNLDRGIPEGVREVRTTGCARGGGAGAAAGFGGGCRCCSSSSLSLSVGIMPAVDGCPPANLSKGSRVRGVGFRARTYDLYCAAKRLCSHNHIIVP